MAFTESRKARVQSLAFFGLIDQSQVNLKLAKHSISKLDKLQI